MSRDGWMRKRANGSDDNGWGEKGGYMAAKVTKLDEQFKLNASREKQKEGTGSSIFSGVSIYVNGYTDPSADELRRLMMVHGGQFHVYYSRSKTTHIIANNLPNCKIQELRGEKVIRPEWITDSIKAGRLLPCFKYQLYAKQKNTLFPAVILRHTSEMSEPSHCPLQPSTHQKPLLPPHNTEPSVPRSGGSSNNPFPVPGCSEAEPQSVRRSSKASLDCHPQSHLKSSQLVSGSLHTSRSLHKNPLPNKGHSKLPHKSPGSAHVNDEDLKINGVLQTSPDTSSHSKMTEMQERGDPCPVGASAAVGEAPLTNGHAHLFNGALKPEGSSPVADPRSSDGDASTCRAKSSTEKPQSSSVQSHAKPDPYEFPPSPPKQSDSLLICLEQSTTQDGGLCDPKPPSSSSHEASRANEPQTPLKRLQPPAQVEPISEQTSRPPPSCSLSSVRLNGSRHKAFQTDAPLPNAARVAAKPDPPTEAPSASTPSDQLLEQTGGLISEFYSHSRLHQISTWRIAFSEYVNELHSKRKTEGSPSYPGKERLRKCMAQRSTHGQAGAPSVGSVKSCIFHVDMDCFFVSVGIRHRPELKGKPVAVTSNRGLGKVPIRPGANHQVELQYYQMRHTHPQPDKADDDLPVTPSQDIPDSHGNGVDPDAATLSMAEIASCSYEARQAGVRNGMFFGKAKQLCPSLQSVPYDFDAYKEVALNMYEILASYTHDIEALSCDEALIDASHLLAEVGVTPDALAEAIRADIRGKTGCCASVGMGSNILLARLATRKAKPNGQYFLRSEEVDDFIRDLPVTSLPGVGHVMAKKLAVMGVKSCGDLQQVSLSQLQKKFGPRTGQTLFRFCRGLDDRPVRFEKERKSVSAEMNYNIRFATVDEAECFLTNLSMEVQRRLKEAGLRGRRVTLKVMVRKVGAPLEPAKYGGHGICDNLAKTVMLAQSTDSGQLIASAIIRLLHAMKLQVQDLRGVGIQVQQLEGNQPQAQDCRGTRTRSIKDMLLGQGSNARTTNKAGSPQKQTSSAAALSSPHPPTPPEPVPGTSKDTPVCRAAQKHSRTRLNLSIEVPSPSQVDRSVLEALPAELREQVEQSWTKRDERPNHCRSPDLQLSSPHPAPYAPPAGTLVLQFPNQPDSPGIVLELPNFSQVDPDVFAALPKELQDELKSAYSRAHNVQPQVKMAEQKNPLLQLKQPAAGTGVGRLKRRYKRKNGVSPVKKGTSPLKRRQATNSPAKRVPPIKPQEPANVPKTEMNPSTSEQDVVVSVTKSWPRPVPTLAGACDLTDIKTLLREWVTTITEPMEEDILQVVKYCTDLIEDKDLEKLDLIIRYMKRLMQQSVESVWSMAFDFILDNIQVVVHQAYGSILKIT
ncbi:PREDICTED: DNA repair protein REV1 isoform X1 [Poecilia mexicana]|uniref:DNA repair protein REV1 n=1 Tax=Poecilia mexicana TaxID=48701 RepID=A0A3B3YAR0_9TELE|nr:PREDICTED: DNA repair protein REV1 isoform X1 [Poecilia mexicana]XP_014860967.1 PREDICTED: DNA repair protein REV1 isoform X1 [Poecilia mexicana]XP_014860968.1 PREDICTED: DNA repair protein REV1 isoform X1 [Poecilia mexicana]XP_014860969.1 PREDICTED: DNA repair protein REV1 isoform X1 [Poecilia mexicana]